MLVRNWDLYINPDRFAVSVPDSKGETYTHIPSALLTK